MYTPFVDKFLFESIIKRSFPTIPSNEWESIYSLKNYKETLIDIHTDCLWFVPSVTLTQRLIENSNDVYFYHFSHEPVLGGINKRLGHLGSGHGYEVNYIFQNRPLANEELYLAQQMGLYWSQFAHSGRVSQ